ncbi:uncharacterized protein N0V96_008718 [Colletotrichum fioriniae]|uniref:uncharacterized protein n=1 Tax=Colletotrichum fioriniae TaxID=710243 RepID=UPI0032D9FE91|nr:hypothetical protein N0V96_008718 [Colletotrichum fioriniae]
MLATKRTHATMTLSGSLPPSGLRVDSSSTSLRPRYLCFVRDFEQGIYETVKVSDYLAQHGDDVDLEFVFVSYTRLQFRVATEEELNKHDYPDEATRNANKEVARQDREILAKWGMDAAKGVGKRAFWLDFECVRNDDGIARSTSSSQDVYRICDIVRAAHSMIIAIGPSANDKVASILASTEPPEYKRENVTPWLRQWGSRLWTLPELLLCPAEYRIRLYVLGDQAEPKELAKRNFAERAWDDAEAVKELVDHFEGSAILTDLRLIEAALACFSRRQTDQFNKGDIAYATMGLFPNRHRPPVNKDDSGFQAFAKLSIANDSGAFLSRLISLSQPDGAPWHRVEDTWGARLSEIFPSVSITGVVGADTVMLDKVHGATIHWDNLEPEPYFDRSFGMRYVVFVGFTYFACFSVPMAFSFFTGIASIVLSDFMRLSIWQVYMWLLPLAIVFALLFPIVVHAVLRSCLALTLVKYMITWYPIKELPLRFLFWNVAFAGLVSSLGLLPEITFNKISLTVDIGGIIFFTNISLLYYAIQVGFSNLIGGPKDITWLLPHQKLYYSQRAASESFYAKAAGAVWWKHQQSLSNALQSFLVFFIALAMSLTSGGVIHEDPVSGAGAVVMTILAGLLIYKFPPSLSFSKLFLSNFWGELMKRRCPEVLWAFMVRQSTSWSGALGSVSLSWMGWALGQIIMDYTDSISTFAAQLPLLIGQIILWALLWVACERESKFKLPEHSQDILAASDRDIEDQDSEWGEDSQ